MFEQHREVGWEIILAALGAQLALSVAVNLWFVPLITGRLSAAGSGSPDGFAAQMYFSLTLFSSLLTLLVVVWGVAMRAGGLRLRDVGWKGRHVLIAAGVTLGAWAAIQLGVGAVQLIRTGKLSAHAGLDDPGAGLLLFGLCEQAFGNALAEETIFRGFLLSQLYLKFGGRRAKARGGPLVAALLVSQGAFSLLHVPNRIVDGVAGTELLVHLGLLFVMGLFYAWIYLETQNLFIAVGIHALFNDPVPLVSASRDLTHLVLVCLTALTLLTWSFMRRRVRRRPPNDAGESGGPRT